MSYIKAYNSYFCVKVHLVYICKWVWLFFNNFVLNIFILHVFFLKLITSLTLTTAMTVCIWPFETCLLRFNLENRTNIFGMSWQKEIGLTNISVLYYWSHLKSLLRSILQVLGCLVTIFVYQNCPFQIFGSYEKWIQCSN